MSQYSTISEQSKGGRAKADKAQYLKDADFAVERFRLHLNEKQATAEEEQQKLYHTTISAIFASRPCLDTAGAGSLESAEASPPAQECGGHPQTVQFQL
mmetsp:Transcript_10623/g.18526  ORF Transcript_10623/g.18526 Transcript_10623/m.18526 type:complete len:99 (+) Transcript_10623:331-627(+)